MWPIKKMRLFWLLYFICSLCSIANAFTVLQLAKHSSATTEESAFFSYDCFTSHFSYHAYIWIKSNTGTMLPNITKVSFQERANRMMRIMTRPINVHIIIATFTPNPFLIIVMSDESQLKNSPIFFSSKNETSL